LRYGYRGLPQIKETGNIDYIVVALGGDGMSGQAALDIRLWHDRHKKSTGEKQWNKNLTRTMPKAI
jgi:hypothetical protein